MKTIALVTQKGGSGKTTIAASLAVAAAEAGETVIVLDLDPQGSLIAWGNDREAETPAVDQIDSDRLSRLPELLASLDKAGMTLVLLDCPGIASTASNLAMKAADLCLLPARPTLMDIRASKATVQTLMGLSRPFAFVLNQCPPHRSSGRATDAAEGLHMMGSLAAPMLGLRADYQDAMAAGQGVTEYSPQGKAADEMRQLWAWTAKRLNDKEKPNGKANVLPRQARTGTA
ncbi:ParA family protein [Methylobacterium sp. WL64]|uniref:ParA family protein n=1 Tax=Methylobacterium sp. WL64 TaxID=2603894 RepID=UPI0011C732FC|nr:ParA family protein [Methylobacterium sp. WL64]TXM96406.1 ParA family protein [Methylobacterium sp. WL64]